MKTLLQSIDDFLEKVSVTDRQEVSIQGSVKNLTSTLKEDESNLNIEDVFTNGSYERDTIISPLNDVDLFAVLNRDEWKNKDGSLPKPQSVLSKIKDYLNGTNDYKDKVKQDRPCVTVELSKIDFDILPSFKVFEGGYMIPNYDLNGWTFSYPEQLSKDLYDVHRLRNYRVKQVVKMLKSWNVDNDKIFPSFHIEEIAIRIFNIYDFVNYEEAVRLWFQSAETYMLSDRFKSYTEYQSAVNKASKVKNKLGDAKKKYDDKKEAEAIKIWKDVFGKKFPAADIEETKAFSKSLTEGTLKMGSAGVLSQSTGSNIPASKGFFGDESENKG